jgi:Flp pilus assembly protein TadD
MPSHVLSLATPLRLGLLLALLTISAYWRVTEHQFAGLDTDIAIVNNPHIQQGLNWRAVSWAFTATDYYDYWHPLPWLTHTLDFVVFGHNAGGHLLMNLVYHMLTVVLLFALLLRLTGALWRSALVAALFAVHPIHVESVAWIVERKDVLAGMFWMLTLLAYTEYVRVPSVGRYLVTVLAFAIGLMAKPMLVTLPCVMLLLDAWPLGRMDAAPSDRNTAVPPPRKPRRVARTALLLLEKAPFLALACGSAAFTYSLTLSKGFLLSFGEVALRARLANAVLSYARYVGKLVWPQNLVTYYPYPRTIAAPELTAAAVLLVGLTAVALLARRSHPYLLWGWLWFLGTLVPVVGLVQTGNQAMADRFVYIPAIGVYVAVVWGLARLVGARPRARFAAGTAALVVLGLLWWCTTRQVETWRDDETVLRHAVAHTQENFTVLNNLGALLAEQGRTRQGLLYLVASMRAQPAYANPYSNMAFALMQMGRYQQAVPFAERALQLNPAHADAHLNLAVALLHTGHDSTAFAHYHEACRLKPSDWSSHNRFGAELLSLGRLDEAAPVLQEARRLAPQSAEPCSNLGLLAIERGRPGEALPYLNEALHIDPSSWKIRCAAGIALLRLGRCAEACVQLSAAIDADSAQSEPHCYRADAYRCRGLADSAISDLHASICMSPQLNVACSELATLFRQRGEADSAAYWSSRAADASSLPVAAPQR